MDAANPQLEAVEAAISNLSKEEIVRLLLGKLGEQQEESIPVAIFESNLSPLEAITRYLKDNRGKKINQIAKLLNKQPSSISEAYKNSQAKPCKFNEAGITIPLSEFERQKDLSILEILVSYLKSKNMRFTEIAALLKRDPRTIWTINSRADSKSGKGQMTLHDSIGKKQAEKPASQPPKKEEMPVRRKRLNISDYIK